MLISLWPDLWKQDIIAQKNIQGSQFLLCSAESWSPKILYAESLEEEVKYLRNSHVGLTHLPILLKGEPD